jgi:beta-lactamase class A
LGYFKEMGPTNRQKPSGWRAKSVGFLGFALFLGGALGAWRYEKSQTPPAAIYSASEESSPEGDAPEPTTAAEAAEAAAQDVAVETDPKDVSWTRMTEELSHLASRHRGRVAIVLRDLGSNKTWTYHPDDLFPSASLIKVPVMIAVFNKINEGGMSLNDTMVLRRRNRVGGSGSLKWRPDGTKLQVRDVLLHMINESDNTATAMLIEAAGLGYIQQQFPKMGLFYTEIYPEGMSIKGGKVAHENYTTAREMTMLMEKIYRGELVSRASSELMMDILRHKKPTASRLAKSLPRGWEIAHKTGLLRQACHDSAVIFTPNGAFAITVLTGQNGDYKSAKDFISRLGRVAYRHYRGDYALAKAGGRRSDVALR